MIEIEMFIVVTLLIVLWLGMNYFLHHTPTSPLLCVARRIWMIVVVGIDLHDMRRTLWVVYCPPGCMLAMRRTLWVVYCPPGCMLAVVINWVCCLLSRLCRLLYTQILFNSSPSTQSFQLIAIGSCGDSRSQVWDLILSLLSLHISPLKLNILRLKLKKSLRVFKGKYNCGGHDSFNMNVAQEFPRSIPVNRILLIIFSN